MDGPPLDISAKFASNQHNHMGRRNINLAGGGDHIPDFYSPETILIIELDGSQHPEEERLECNKKRTKYLESQELR